MNEMKDFFKYLKKVTSSNPDLNLWNAAINDACIYPEIYRFLKNIPYIDSGFVSFDQNIKNFKFGGESKFSRNKGSIIDWVKTIDPQLIKDLNIDFLAGFESLHKIITEADKSHENPLHYKYSHDSPALSGKDLVVTSCDINYFEFYAKNFCSSFFYYNDNHKLVINLIYSEMPDKVVSIVNELLVNYKNLLIIFSETSDNRKSLYANGRFLILDELFKNDPNSITTVDIDCIFIGKVDLFHKAMKYSTDSIGLIISPAIQFPWYYTMAGFVYFPNSVNIKSKIKYLISLISCLYSTNSNHNYWYSDQNALLIFFILYEIKVTRVGIEHLRKVWNQVGASSKGLVAPK